MIDEHGNRKKVWYDQAQEILNNPFFNQGYNKDWGVEELANNLGDINEDSNTSINNFRDVQNFLAGRSRQQNYESALFQSPFQVQVFLFCLA